MSANTSIASIESIERNKAEKRNKTRRARKGFAKRRNPYVVDKGPGETDEARHLRAETEQQRHRQQCQQIEQGMEAHVSQAVIECYRGGGPDEVRGKDLEFALSGNASLVVRFTSNGVTVKGDGPYGVLREALDAAELDESKRFWLHSIGGNLTTTDASFTSVQSVITLAQGGDVAERLHRHLAHAG